MQGAHFFPPLLFNKYFNAENFLFRDHKSTEASKVLICVFQHLTHCLTSALGSDSEIMNLSHRIASGMTLQKEYTHPIHQLIAARCNIHFRCCFAYHCCAHNIHCTLQKRQSYYQSILRNKQYFSFLIHMQGVFL